MNLIFFEGVMGAGKTFGMSVLATHWQSLSGCSVYSNYGLKGSKPFTTYSDFEKIAIEPSSLVCLDESHMDISSRDFNANSVKWFTNMVFYLRKLRCTLLMTSPLFENVDTRVRGVTNILARVSKDQEFFFYDFYNVQEEKYIKTKRIRQSLIGQLNEDLFDTYSMVVPLEYPDKKEEYLKILSNVRNLNEKYLRSREGSNAL